jgi:hypothetical protein
MGRLMFSRDACTSRHSSLERCSLVIKISNYLTDDQRTRTHALALLCMQQLMCRYTIRPRHWRTNEKLAYLHIEYMCYQGRSGDNMFILALAVANMIMMSIGIPVELLNARFPMYIGQFEPVCKLFRYFESSANGFGGILTLLIALDRYYTVTKPMSRYGDKSRPRVRTSSEQLCLQWSAPVPTLLCTAPKS